MKNYLIFSTLIVLFFSACSKKDNATPVAKHPAIIDSSRVADSTIRISVSPYPHTDTFIGTFSVSFIYDYYSGLDTNYSNYKFYVTHLSENVLIFNSTLMVQVLKEPIYWIMNKPDTGTLDFDSTFQGAMYIYDAYPTHDQGNMTFPNGYTFQLTGGKLSVNWDDTYFPVPGTCDGGESKGQFIGLLK